MDVIKPFNAKAKAFKTFLPANAWNRFSITAKKPITSLEPKATPRERKQQASIHEEDQLQELSTMSLDDFFQEHTTQESTVRLSLKISDKELQTCFRESLKLIFSPISSQLPREFSHMTTDDEFLCGKLVDTLRYAFRELSLTFEQEWREIYMESFPPIVNSVTKEPLMITPVDHGLRNVYLRKFLMQEKHSKQRDQFSSEQEFNRYVQVEQKDVDSLIKRAREYRTKPFTFKLDVNIQSATFVDTKCM
jgi:hypothetical protein